MSKNKIKSRNWLAVHAHHRNNAGAMKNRKKHANKYACRNFKGENQGMDQRTKNKVISWMAFNLNQFVELSTGEVSCTALAEAAADHFDLYENDHDIPDELFDLAVEAYQSVFS